MGIWEDAGADDRTGADTCATMGGAGGSGCGAGLALVVVGAMV